MRFAEFYSRAFGGKPPNICWKPQTFSTTFHYVLVAVREGRSHLFPFYDELLAFALALADKRVPVCLAKYASFCVARAFT